MCFHSSAVTLNNSGGTSALGQFNIYDVADEKERENVFLIYIIYLEYSYKHALIDGFGAV